MRLGIVDLKDGGHVPVLITREESITPIRDLIGEPSPKNLLEILQDQEVMLKLSKVEPLGEVTKKNTHIEQFRWAPPLVPIRNILCVGKNYAAHIQERMRVGDSTIPLETKPIFFTKATTSVIGSGENVVAWKSTSQVDYEAELAVIIGRHGKDISRTEAVNYVFGYTLINDVTARDLQEAHRQWFRGKSLDTFCPLGPYIVTTDEIQWPINVNITLAVNDKVRQNFWTKDMIFDIPTIISELSKSMTLLPGDVIATGTADGCGSGLSPPSFLKPGDQITIRCEQLGCLENRVIAE